jgi:hypothetical protein
MQCLACKSENVKPEMYQGKQAYRCLNCYLLFSAKEKVDDTLLFCILSAILMERKKDNNGKSYLDSIEFQRIVNSRAIPSSRFEMGKFNVDEDVVVRILGA